MTQATYIFRKTDTHYVVPVIKSWQGGKTFYSANLPMRHVVELIPQIDQHTKTEERAQRSLNKRRGDKIAEYIQDNPENYVLPALTVSLLETGLRRTKFIPITDGEQMGELFIPLGQRPLISDGQHRLYAINQLINGKVSDIHDSIALTIYDNVSLDDAKQLFTDINLNAAKPSGSINSLFDKRDPWNSLAKIVAKKAKILDGRTEYEKNSCTAKSHCTFALKTVVDFCKRSMHAAPSMESINQSANYIIEVLDQLHANIFDWKEATNRSIYEDKTDSLNDKEFQSNVQFRREYYISLNAVALDALALYMREAQGQLFTKNKFGDQDERLKEAAEGLKGIDWSKDNELWKGRCIRAERIVKNRDSVILTANALLKHAGYSLPFDYETVEAKYASELKN